jgi:putative ABC transport system permease protein
VHSAEDARSIALISLSKPGSTLRTRSARRQLLDPVRHSAAVVTPTVRSIARRLATGAALRFALFIGMFIIYNAFASAVTQRRSEIGILRALGASQGQIRSLFIGESACIGMIGSIGGLALGILMARAIASSVSTLISDVYGVAQKAEELATGPILLLSALAAGVATSLVAAAIPARHAARVDPVHALQKGKHESPPARETRVRAMLAGLCAIFALASLTVTTSRPMFYAGYAAAIGAAVLLGPLATLALARTIRPLLKWLRPVEGALAADSLVQSPRRTSASVAALMLSLALVVAFSGMARASALDRGWMNTSRSIPTVLLAKPRHPDDQVSCDDGFGNRCSAWHPTRAS